MVNSRVALFVVNDGRAGFLIGLIKIMERVDDLVER